MDKPLAWSYSALTTFEQCPKKFYHLRVKKDVKDGDNEHTVYGKEVHDALHKRVIKGEALPLRFRHIEPVVAQLAKAKGEKHGEMRLALNRKFEPVDFFAKDVYVRVVVDLLIVDGTRATIIDYKTGKVKDEWTQLELTAAVLSKWMPELTEFRLAFLWLQEKNLSRKDRTKEELVEVWANLLPRVGAIESAISTTSFSARPSGLCRYCPITFCPEKNARS